MDGSTVKTERLAVSVLKELRVPPILHLCSVIHVLTRNVGEVLPRVNRQDKQILHRKCNLHAAK